MTDSHQEQTPLLSNKRYAQISFIVTLLLPALATFYAALAVLWDWPYGEQVVGTIAALATLLGVFLRKAEKTYDVSGAKYDGVLAVHSQTDDDGDISKTLSMEFDGDPYDLDEQPSVSFRVEKR